MGQEYRSGLAGFLLTELRSVSKLTPYLADHLSLCWLLARGLCHMVLFIGEFMTWFATFCRASKQKGREREREEAIDSLSPSLRSDILSLLLYFIGSESLGPVCTQGEGVTLRHENQEAGITGGYLRDGLPHYQFIRLDMQHGPSSRNYC